jgi:hypothetical protein
MTAVFTFEGMRVRGEMISRDRLVSIWNTLTTKQFPKVAAFQLEERDFEHIVRLRRCREDEIREVQEWGRLLSVKGTDACVLNAEGFADLDYVILIRQNPYHALNKILEHELSHIVKGDL